jgi:thioredoxin-dependent peroxiredoxin
MSLDSGAQRLASISTQAAVAAPVRKGRRLPLDAVSFSERFVPFQEVGHVIEKPLTGSKDEFVFSKRAAPWGRGSRHVAVALSLVLAACGSTTRPDGGKGLLAKGAVAPDFEAREPGGSAVRLSGSAGSPRVVYFYPKDETPGCIKEACAFRDAFEKFRVRGVVIFGVSRDSVESHQQFQTHYTLPFALAADEGGSIQAAYGVPSRLGHAARVTFLVGRDGRIVRVFPDVDPAVHAPEVLAAVPAE